MAALIVACQPKVQPVDTAAEKFAINSMMENYLTAWKSKDVNTLINLLSDDGLFCGTDPSELMDKKTISDAWKQIFSDSTFNTVFVVDKRVIRVVPDGKSALVMEQYLSNPYTTKIPWRLLIQTIKIDEGWKIDFLSMSLIPRNEDVES